MPDLQGVSALFRAMDAAVMANQAVVAGDMAARQGIASMQLDARRQAMMVGGTLESAKSAVINGGTTPQERDTGRRARRGARPSGASEGPRAQGPAHRIDLIA
jgi:hypothetical protein